MTVLIRRRENRRATYQDVLDVPAHMVAEVIAGTLHTHPRPATRHARASSAIGAKIAAPLDFGDDSAGGWWIIDGPELHLGEDIVVPDLVGWQRQTMPEFPNMAYCTITPDWICEVLSPSTRRLDQGKKRDLYAREGVRHLWFVDPDARTLEVFELREGQWWLLATLVDDLPVSLPPFEAITFPLDALWLEVIEGAKDGESP